jgi:selenocysteine-specific elongation factor
MLISGSNEIPGFLLNAELHFLKKNLKPIKNRTRIKLFTGTLAVNALLIIIGDKQILPGQKSLVQFRLTSPAVLRPGDRFIVSPVNTRIIIGGGIFLEIPTEKFNLSRADKIIPYLHALQQNDIKTFVNKTISASMYRPVSAAILGKRSYIDVNALSAEIQSGIKTGLFIDCREHGVIAKKHYLTLKDTLLKTVNNILDQNTIKSCVNNSEILDKLPFPLDHFLLRKVIDTLCSEKKLTRVDGGYFINNYDRTHPLEENKLTKLILDFAEKSHLVPFSVKRLALEAAETFNEDKATKMLHFLHNQNQLIRLTNKRFISVNAMAVIKQTVRSHIETKGRLTIQDSNALLGYGRTMAVPVYEYLDSIGFTIRQNDFRIMLEDNH